MNIKEIYEMLMNNYGPQGWWPLLSHHGKGDNPTMRGVSTGYHKNDFSIPASDSDILEVMVGSILAQNTSWLRAEAAIVELNNHKYLSIEKIDEISVEELAEIIRTSGYYNQKAARLKLLVEFLKANPIDKLKKMSVPNLREILLTIKGVGNETADSMILYALQKPIMVIDAYTKRFFSRMGFCKITIEYNDLQKKFHDQYEKEKGINKVHVYNEYHALIVQHCVHVCLKKPKCNECIFNSTCPKTIEEKKPKKPRKKTQQD
jgi:endonuclease-3 related protein